MIGYVRGIVTHLFKESCYVDVHGVGYRVYVPTTTRQQLIEGHEATLFTYLNVREDAMQLYGFWTEEDVFECAGRCNATLWLLDGRGV